MASLRSFYYSVDYHRFTDIKDLLKRCKAKHAAGEEIYIKITSGAREGTIGKLRHFDWDALYTEHRTTGVYGRHEFRRNKDEWVLEFDDRKNAVACGMASWSPAFETDILFDYQGPTQWVYTTVSRGRKERVFKDHFGQEFKLGDVCQFVAKYGKNDYRMRYGKFTRFSDAGTMWFKPFLTREDHRINEEECKVEASMARDVVLLSDDVRRMVMMAKLANGGSLGAA